MSTDRASQAGAAVVTGAAALLPVPFVDDWLAARSRRHLIERALRSQGRSFPARELRALYQDDGSWLGLPWRVVKGLMLVPVKKLFRSVFLVLGVRDVALAVGRTLALGHTVERQLRFGMFREDAAPAVRADEARRLRRALDHAWQGIDQRLVQRAANLALERVRGGAKDAGEIEGFLAELDRRVDQALAGIA